MRWEDSRESENVEDRRGDGGGFGGGGGFPLPIGGGLGIGGLIVVGVIAYALGINPLALLQGFDTGPQTERWQPVEHAERGAPPADAQGRFVAAVLGQTEDVWREVLPAQSGRRYED